MPKPPLRTCFMSFLITSAFIMLVPVADASAEVATPGDVIKIDADHQSYDAATKKYALSGNVNVTYRDFLIKGSEADLDVDDQGQPQRANFYHRPNVRRIHSQMSENSKKTTLEDNIKGDVVRIYLTTNRFGAEGNVDSQLATADGDPFVIHSDTQTFDNNTKLVTANGNVRVDYKSSVVTSASVMMRMKDDGKADRVVFSGGAHIVKDDSRISGEKITVMMDSGNLIAENHVNTQVDLKPPKDGTDKVIIQSDYQEYDKASDKMIASGHVHLVMGGYTASSGKATFTLNGGQLDRVLLTDGRPSITDKDRTIVANKITITTSPRHFDAVGNVQIRFKTAAAGTPTAQTAPAQTSAANGKKPPAKSGKVLVKPAVVAKPAGAPPEDDELKY